MVSALIAGSDDARRLGGFLRARRESLAPDAVGLTPTGRRRRVGGLRRDEVAARANISADYYARMEQGRVAPPSARVLAALADALLLDAEAELYLREIAHGIHPKAPPAPAGQVPSRVHALLDDFATLPAVVMSPFMHVLAWNRHAAALFLDFGAIREPQRNLARLIYLDEHLRGRFVDWAEIARACTAIIRTGAARDPDNAELAALVDELVRCDPVFARTWGEQDVARRPRSRSPYVHPEVGSMVLDWQILTGAENPDQLVAVISPGDSAGSVEAFRALARRTG